MLEIKTHHLAGLIIPAERAELLGELAKIEETLQRILSRFDLKGGSS